MKNIGLMMVVRNEKDKIRQCLDWHLPYIDEVAIVDQQSNDGTWEILQEYQKVSQIPFHVAQDKMHGYCEPSKQMAADLLNSEWLLYLDPDEKFPKNFLERMHELIENDAYDGFTFRRDNIFEVTVFDNNVPIGPKVLSILHPAHDYQFRLTKKKYSYFPPFLHHRVRIKKPKNEPEKIGKTIYHIEHRKTIRDQWDDNKRYNIINKKGHGTD